MAFCRGGKNALSNNTIQLFGLTTSLYLSKKNGFDIAHSFLGVGLSLLQTSKPSWLVAHTWEQNWSKLYTEYRHEWKQYEYVKIQLWFLIFSSYRICSLPFSVPNMKHTHTHIWNHHLRHHMLFASLSVNLHTKSPHVTSFCSWLLWGEYKPCGKHSFPFPSNSQTLNVWCIYPRLGSLGGKCTPLKINLESKTHPIDKEHHLPSTSIFVFQFAKFSRVYVYKYAIHWVNLASASEFCPLCC